MEVRVPWPIRALVVLASVATPLIALCAAIVAKRALNIDGQLEWPILVGPPAVVVLIQWLVLRRATPVPRWIRATCVLVAMHACLVAAIAGLWFHASAVLKLDRLLPLTALLPIEQPVAVAAGILLAVAAVWLPLARGRGVPGWLEDVVAFLLVHLLALGLFVPFVAYFWPSQDEFVDVPPVALVLLPTTIVAAVCVLAVRLRRNVPLRERARALPVVVVITTAVTIVLAAVMTNDSRWVYSNFGPLIVGNAFLALLGINVLGVFHWLAIRPRKVEAAGSPLWAQTGQVAAEGDHVAWVRCRGYMEGLHVEAVPFHVRTAAGRLEVPAGTTVIAPLPLSTIHLQRDGEIPLLAKDDPIRASGYVAAPSAGPFRESSLPIPGRHVTVEALDRPVSFGQNAVLAVWRTCCLYLVVATLVAIPAIVASVTYEPHRFSIMRSGFAQAPVCGYPDKPCCGEEETCLAGFVCGPKRICQSCGGEGEPCCGNTCAEHLYCNAWPTPTCVTGNYNRVE